MSVEKTLFISHRVGGELTDAYSVKLSSSDGSYGVKEIVSGDIIVADNTLSTNVRTGVYEYTATFDLNTEYIVSWEIVSFEGDTPTYQTQVVGPFINTPDNIKAIASKRGSLRQGGITALILKVTDLDGTVKDPEELSLTITNNSTAETPVAVTCIEKVTDGCYVYEWNIDDDQDAGRYTATWSYTVDGYEYEELQDITVVQDCTDTSLYSGQILLVRQSLNLMLDCAQHVPVYYQQAQPSRDNLTFKWTRKNWNQTPGTRIYRNGVIVNSGLEINYDQGTVTFDEPLTQYDTVHADYNFRWFSDEKLDRFISNAIHTINSNAPHTTYNITNLPEKYIGLMLYLASVDAIRSLMLCMNFQEPAQFFGGSDSASDKFKNLQSLKENYEESSKALLEQKKLGSYVGLTRSVVTPEFTLPGGRSRWFRYLFK